MTVRFLCTSKSKYGRMLAAADDDAEATGALEEADDVYSADSDFSVSSETASAVAAAAAGCGGE